MESSVSGKESTPPRKHPFRYVRDDLAWHDITHPSRVHTQVLSSGMRGGLTDFLFLESSSLIATCGDAADNKCVSPPPLSLLAFSEWRWFFESVSNCRCVFLQKFIFVGYPAPTKEQHY